MTQEQINLTLYHYWRSSSSWRVRLALSYKQISYESVLVNLAGGEQDHADYLKQNPLGHVPCLKIGNGESSFTLIESVAICEWLEETFPEHPLLPTTPDERAKVRALCQIINADIQPLQNLRVLKSIETFGEDKSKWARFWIERGLHAFQKQCASYGDFCLGETLSLADFFLVPQLYNARRFDCDLSPFKRLLQIEESVQKMSFYQQAHPDVFKES